MSSAQLLVARRGAVDLLEAPSGRLLASAPIDGQPMLVEVAPDASVAWALTDVDGAGLLWTLSLAGGALAPVGDPVATGGGLPCSLAIDSSRERLVVANYGGEGELAGGLSAFEIGSGGIPAFVAAWADAPRVGPPTERHTVSHPHHVAFAGDVLRAVDLGDDRVTWFSGWPFSDPRALDLHRGWGPRWAISHGRRVLVCAEIESVLVELSEGAPGVVERVTAIPGATSATNHLSEIVPLGADRFVLAARGSSRLSVLEAPPGRDARVLQTVDLPGRWPVSLAYTGDLVIVACREPGRLLGFLVSDGLLEPVPAMDVVAIAPNGVRAIQRKDER